MDISAILNGHLNEVLGLNKDIATPRLKICSECPLLRDTAFGPICDSKVWIDLETGDISYKRKAGYKNGCGCRLTAKTTLINAKCPIGKW